MPGSYTVEPRLTELRLTETRLNRNDRRKNRIIIFRDRGDEKKLATMFAASNAFLLPLPRIPVPAFRSTFTSLYRAVHSLYSTVQLLSHQVLTFCRALSRCTILHLLLL